MKVCGSRLILCIAVIVTCAPLLYYVVSRFRPRYLKNKLLAQLSAPLSGPAAITVTGTPRDYRGESQVVDSQDVQLMTTETFITSRIDTWTSQRMTTETFTTSRIDTTTVALRTPPWSFNYLALTVNGRQCPTTCDAHVYASCGRCIRIGDGMRPAAETRLYEVTNVFYVTKQGAWFYGPDEQTVIDCGTVCRPTWESWPEGGYNWYEWDTQPRSRVKPSISCDASNTIVDPVLLVRWMSPFSMHHFYTDTVLATFMTVGHIAKVFGYSSKQVKVYMTAGLVGTSFPDMWNLLFTEIRGADTLNGCYERVFYGYMFNNVLRFSQKGIFYDPTLSSWMRAFQLNLRAGLVPAELLKAPPGALLFVQNSQVPDWIRKIDWSVSGVEIERVDLLILPYKDQLSKVAVSRGLLAVSGLGIPQHLFLRPGSPVGWLALLELAEDKRTCVARLSQSDPSQVQQEHAMLAQANTAINAGHTFLMWRWCRPDIFDEKWGFTSQHAQVVLQLLFSLNSDVQWSSKVHACYVLDGNPNSDGWPRCDHHLVAPSPRFTGSCEAYSCGGQPYNLDDSSSYTRENQRVKFVPYVARPKWLWKGKVSDVLSSDPESQKSQQAISNGFVSAAGLKTPRWSFNYMPISAKGKNCPTTCDANVQGSCGRCIRIGNGMKFETNSHIFEVSNVVYIYEQGAWFYGPDVQLVKDCGAACGPTWEGWPMSDFQWYEFSNQPRTSFSPHISCDAGDIVTEPAVLVRWFFPLNAYHFYTDTVLSTYMTVGHISNVLGVPSTDVKVHVVAGLSQSYFMDMWKLLFSEVLAAEKMDGCYKRVFYGHMWHNVPAVDMLGTIFDPVLSSWMAAWRSTLRAGLVPAELLKATPASLLRVHHDRAPDWFKKLDFSIPGVEMERVDFAKMPYKEQVAKVAGSRGLFGIGGSGFAQQVFLPPRSMIGYLAIFEQQVDNKCMARLSKSDPSQLQGEENSLCYANSAINLGNHVLVWRWCRPDIFDETWGFTSQHAQAVLKLLLSLKSDADASGKVHACYVLDNNPNSKGWPRCDQHITAPALHFAESCDSFGCGGLPYNIEDNTSYLQHDNRVLWTPYMTGPQWLWAGKVAASPSSHQASEEDQSTVPVSTTVATTVSIADSTTVSNTESLKNAVGADVTNNLRWKFSYRPGKGCPKTCDYDNGSCGVCIQIGNGMRGYSRIFEVSNVFYVKSQGAWFYGPLGKQVKACGTNCNPTWDGWPSNGYQWFEWDGQPRSRKRPQISCDASNTIADPVLLVRWMFPLNAYHFYTDTVLSTYMTVGHIAHVLGCSPKQVQVRVIAGLLPTYFPDLWATLFSGIAGADLLDGCYKKAYYGHMYYNVPAVTQIGTLYDRTLSSWMAAWRLNVRAWLVPASLLNAPPGAILHISHGRAPDWFRKVVWNIPGVEIKNVDFARLSYKQQIATVGPARGLVGIGGSGMAQQLFLRPGSVVGYLAVLEARAGKCVARMSKTDAGHIQDEDASQCYVNSGINMGNTVLLWRWCRPEIFNEKWGFGSAQAQAVLKLLLSLKSEADKSDKVRACYVLDTNVYSVGWPRCDQLVTAPAPHFTSSCDTYGCGAQPYNVIDSSSIIDRKTAKVQLTPYAAGPKWLWQGTVTTATTSMPRAEEDKKDRNNSLASAPTPRSDENKKDSKSLLPSAPLQRRWVFISEKLSVRKKVCPKTCDSALASCGRCIKIGNGMRGQNINSHIYEVSNVFFKQGAWFYGPDEQMVISCGSACNPTWEAWPPGGYAWHRYEYQAPKRKRLPFRIQCDAHNTSMQPVLFVRWLFPNNAYHFYVDTVLSTYMTVGHIANVLNCSHDEVKVHIIAGSSHTLFPKMWIALFGKIRMASQLKGCYKRVYYGMMFLNVFWVDTPGTIYDPTLASWMAAWKLNLRALMIPPKMLNQPRGPMLLVHHNRAPGWFHYIDWGIPDVEIQRVDFAKMSYAQQVAKAGLARGLFGIGGSGMTQLVYLAPGSLVGYIIVLQQTKDGRGCVARMSKVDPNHIQQEDSSLCYANVAVNMGINVLAWRWCRPDIFNDEWGFAGEQAHAVLRLLLSLNKDDNDSGKVHACYVLDGNPYSPGWPRCDQRVTAPALSLTKSCDHWGCGAEPYNRKDYSSFLVPDRRVKYTPYTGITKHKKWLWGGRVPIFRPQKKANTKHETRGSTTVMSTVTTTSAVTTSSVGRPWTLNYVPLVTAKGQQCPISCNSQEDKTCGRCVRLGNGMRGGAYSSIFEVSNAFYVQRQGSWFYGPDEQLVKDCGSVCHPSWDGWPTNGYQWYDWDTQPRSRVRPDISCDAGNTHTDPILLVAWMFPFNVHHFYAETVLPTFLAVGYIAQVLGISKNRVKPYVIFGLVGPFAPDIWKTLFTEIQGADLLNGCYKTAFYGHAYMNVPEVNLGGVVHDPTLSSWSAAFRYSIRRGLVSEKLLETAPGGLLFVKHLRAPDWLEEVDWSIPGLAIEEVDFAKLPYSEQISKIAISGGLLGVSGSGLAQHVFLPPGSLLGIILMLDDSSGCQARMSKTDPSYLQEENTALCYVNTAVNTGTATLMWRWCQPDIYSRSAAFTSEQAKAVLKLFLSLRAGTSDADKVSVCLVLDGDVVSAGWPRCDQHIVAPAPCSPERCKIYGSTGLAYNPQDNSSYILRDERVKFTAYEVIGGKYKPSTR